ncbi:MAG: replication initiation protein [Syntrophomonas sp.]
MEKKNQVVKKHNALVQCRAGGMGLRGMRVMALTASKISVNDADLEMYDIPVKGIAPDTAKNSYAEIKEISEKLQSQRIIIEEIGSNNKKKFSSYILFIKCEYTEGQGCLHVQFHPDLKKYFLQLKDNFTQYDLVTLLRIPSSYSFKLYENLKSHYNKFPYKKRVYLEEKIDVIQGMLGINENNAPSYLKWKDFSKWVLKPAIKHLRENTEIRFEYKGYAKSGRKFTHIRFDIWEVEDNTSIEVVSKLESNPKDVSIIFDLIPKKYRNLKTIRSVIQKHTVESGAEYVIRNIKYANAKSKSSYRTFLLKALKDDWGLDWEENESVKSGPEPSESPEIRDLREKYAGQWEDENKNYCTVVVNSQGRIFANGQQIQIQNLKGWRRL